MRQSIASLFLLTIAGCGGLLGRGGGDDASAPYAITTNRTEYARGSTGEATIRNQTDGTLLYNLCPRRLERRVGESWVSSQEWPGSGGACTLELRSLAPGQSVNTLFEIPATVSAGTYRVVFAGLKGRNEGAITADQQATPAFATR